MELNVRNATAFRCFDWIGRDLCGPVLMYFVIAQSVIRIRREQHKNLGSIPGVDKKHTFSKMFRPPVAQPASYLNDTDCSFLEDNAAEA